MSWWNILLVAVGVLLGALWLLQGLDLVHLRPILCVTDCKPVTGGSLAWFITGMVTLFAGLFCAVAGVSYWHRGRV